MNKKFFNFLILTTLLTASNQIKNLKMPEHLKEKLNQPVIAIISTPMSNFITRAIKEEYDGYIPSSYKKWIEQTGARPIVLPHFLHIGAIEGILRQVNGVVFIGGAKKLIM